MKAILLGLAFVVRIGYLKLALACLGLLRRADLDSAQHRAEGLDAQLDVCAMAD